jgi:hypothetical protein
VHAPLPSRIFSHIRQREEGPSGEIITSDIILMDEQGNELVSINGFVMRRVDPQSLIETMEEAPAAESEAAAHPVMESQQSTNDDVKFGIFPAEGVEALRRILSARLGPQVIVCVEGLQRKIDRTAKVTRASVEEQLANLQLPVVASERNLANEYVAPSTEQEKAAALSEEEAASALQQLSRPAA